MEKETPTQLLSCYEVFKNIYFEEHLHMGGSELTLRRDCLDLCFWTFALKTI